MAEFISFETLLLLKVWIYQIVLPLYNAERVVELNNINFSNVVVLNLC